MNPPRIPIGAPGIAESTVMLIIILVTVQWFSYRCQGGRTQLPNFIHQASAHIEYESFLSFPRGRVMRVQYKALIGKTTWARVKAIGYGVFGQGRSDSLNI